MSDAPLLALEKKIQRLELLSRSARGDYKLKVSPFTWKTLEREYPNWLAANYTTFGYSLNEKLQRAMYDRIFDLELATFFHRGEISFRGKKRNVEIVIFFETTKDFIAENPSWIATDVGSSELLWKEKLHLESRGFMKGKAPQFCIFPETKSSEHPDFLVYVQNQMGDGWSDLGLITTDAVGKIQNVDKSTAEDKLLSGSLGNWIHLIDQCKLFVTQ
ncbi:MAG: hypothetical protein H7301_02880 [Cryobacterium sp.]|nr:hypothetical protein [Oligoflexia bacterium]